MKVLCRFCLEASGLVRYQEYALVVLYHYDHGCEEKCDWKQESIKHIQSQGQAEVVGWSAQIWTPKDIIEDEVLVNCLALFEVLSTNPTPLRFAQFALHPILRAFSRRILVASRAATWSITAKGTSSIMNNFIVVKIDDISICVDLNEAFLHLQKSKTFFTAAVQI